MSGANDAFSELNRLQSELDAMRVKYDNQLELAQAKDSRIHELELEVKDLQDRLLDEEHVRSSQSTVSDELRVQQSKRQALEAQNAALRSEINSMVASMETSADNSQRQNQQYDELQQSFTQVKNLAATFERKLQATETKLSEVQYSYQMARKLETDAQARIAEMEEQSKLFLSVSAERDAAVLEVRSMEERVEEISQHAASRQHELQNELQRTRQLLEELKVEYEEFSQVTRLEHDMEKRSLQAQHQELVERFENHKLRELEVTQNLLQEQQDIVHALQSQFLEYRQTAETLFEAEARKLEEKLKGQAEAYELELSAIVKARDHQFLQMVTSKDAKIMSLIEGTDMQRVMMKHQAEIDQLKQQHQRDVQLAREVVQSEQRKLVSALREQVRELENRVEAAANEIRQRELQLQEKEDQMKRYKERVQVKESQHEHTQREHQAQLNLAYAQIEQLTQVRENLRHRILRLRLRLEGKADDSTESVVRRLALESDRLNTELEELNAKYRKEITLRTTAEGHLRHAERSLRDTEQKLEEKEVQFEGLTHTFERVLRNQALVRGVSLGEANETTRVVNDTSPPSRLHTPAPRVTQSQQSNRSGTSRRESLLSDSIANARAANANDLTIESVGDSLDVTAAKTPREKAEYNRRRSQIEALLPPAEPLSADPEERRRRGTLTPSDVDDEMRALMKTYNTSLGAGFMKRSSKADRDIVDMTKSAAVDMVREMRESFRQLMHFKSMSQRIMKDPYGQHDATAGSIKSDRSGKQPKRRPRRFGKGETQMTSSSDAPATSQVTRHEPTSHQPPRDLGVDQSDVSAAAEIAINALRIYGSSASAGASVNSSKQNSPVPQPPSYGRAAPLTPQQRNRRVVS